MRFLARRCSRRALVAVALTVATATAGTPATATEHASAEPSAAAAEAQIAHDTGGTAEVVTHEGTELVRFVGTEPGRPLPTPEGVEPGAPAAEVAEAVLEEGGVLFGVDDVAEDLELESDRRRGGGSLHAVRFRQVHDGVPVLGGELVVTVDGRQDVRSIAGEIAPDLEVPDDATISASDARRIATRAVAKDEPDRILQVTDGEQWIHAPALVESRDRRSAALTWRFEVTSPTGDVRWDVLVDATTGDIVRRVDLLTEAKDRRVCNRNNVVGASETCSTAFTRVEGGAATGIADVDDAYDLSGATYDYYADRFGRDSFNGAGGVIRSTVKYCPSVLECPYENAYWNGLQMVYGAGFASADDVVAHEITHAVTQYESNLDYAGESGAINESLSDIFGELVDLDHEAGDDSEDVRWEMGEDLPIGTIRHMADPTLYDQPDRMGSPLYYTGFEDNGGVHINSGVSNKAAYLLVDGDTFNGSTVTAIGAEKVAAIYYAAQTNLLTTNSDYADLATALPQACTNLIGTDGVTEADCAEVDDAVAATEMAGAPQEEVPECEGEGDAAADLFADDIEVGSLWRFARTVGTTSWRYDLLLPVDGLRSLWGPDPARRSDLTATLPNPVAIPTGVSAYVLFDHWYAFEADYDGGVVELSENGGPWTDAGELFTHQGYTGSITTGTGNPIGGRDAFVGDGYQDRTSRIDVSSFAGSTLNLRFRVAADSSIDDEGWTVDNVRVLVCGDEPTVTVTSPDGGESWAAGSTQSVTWSTTGIATTVDVTLLRDGEVDRVIRAGAPAAAGSTSWALPASLTPASDYSVRVDVVGSEATDDSDATFAVTGPTIRVTSPNGGESWVAGSTQSITWTSSGAVGSKVNVTLLKAGSQVAVIKSRGANNGSLSWRLPSNLTPGADYTVRVASATTSVTDTSDATFTVVAPPAPAITITAPNGGETFTRGGTHAITWTATSTVTQSLTLKLYRGATLVRTLKTGLSAAAGTWSWRVPTTFVVAGDYVVRAQAGAVFDTSDAAFSVS